MGGGLQVKLIIITVNSLQFPILTFREYCFDLVGLALKAQGPLSIALGSLQANVSGFFLANSILYVSRHAHTDVHCICHT